jgi:hypothetical protein
MAPEQKAPEPPPPPEIDRRLRLYRWQWVGLPVLVLIPVLALFGVFGHTRGDARAVTGALELDVQYSTRYRFRDIQPMYARVRNRSTAALDTVTVAFDTAYVDRFSTVTFKPDISRAYEVELMDVLPGEVRLVTVELQGERYWGHEGIVSVWHAGGDTASARVSTFIFP